METTWTKPYCGVSHLNLPATYRGQITREEYSTFTRVCVLNFNSLHPFTPVAEETFPTTKQAEAWGEKQARMLGLL